MINQMKRMRSFDPAIYLIQENLINLVQQGLLKRIRQLKTKLRPSKEEEEKKSPHIIHESLEQAKQKILHPQEFKRSPISTSRSSELYQAGITNTNEGDKAGTNSPHQVLKQQVKAINGETKNKMLHEVTNPMNKKMDVPIAPRTKNILINGRVSDVLARNNTSAINQKPIHVPDAPSVPKNGIRLLANLAKNQ